MSGGLVQNIRRQTELMFVNAEIMLKTCDLGYILCGMPVWKHAYHMLHSCDQWFISPFEYEKEPDFHVPGLNSLDIPADGKVLTRDQLISYLGDVRAKILGYLDSLGDEELCEIPKGCVSNRLGLILSQYRHFYAHLGNINATTIIETDQWPRVLGTSAMKDGKPTADGLFE